MSTKRAVALIDYGMGNIASVYQALIHCGAEVITVTQSADLPAHIPIVLPGVGAFGDGMYALRDRGLVEPLQRCAREGGALLGICLGMQMLFDTGEEFGSHSGLGILAGSVTRIPSEVGQHQHRKLPHIGWADLRPASERGWTDTFLAGLPTAPYVYFVHSYTAHPARQSDIVATCDYEGLSIVAAVQNGRVVGCQFHPEKSGEVGLSILSGFLQFP